MTKAYRKYWLSMAKNWFKRYKRGDASAEQAMWRCLLRWASDDRGLL